MKVTGYIIVLAVAGLSLISCSKDAVRSEGGTAVAYIGLAADADGTKSSIDSLSVSWMAGDDIFYYTGRYTSGSSTALTDEGLYKVPEACDNLKLPVEYNNGDNRVTVLTKGRAVGTITPASLNSLTIADAVPASQDGTFASTYIAACEGNLLEFTALTSGEPKNLTMTPVQAFVRFKLSSLTVGGQTVNRITVAGKVGGSAVPVCGDLSVSITENGSSTHTVSSAAGSNTGNLITIDKSGSKFNAGEYIYVALLPRQYDELTLTLYNGGTTLATVPVKQGSRASSTVINASGGRMVDLSVADAINDHAKIKFVSAKMYPEKVAIIKDRTSKYLWLKIEPQDFNGTVTWSSDKPEKASVTETGIEIEDEQGIGKCIRATVTNHETSYGTDYDVTITATITDLNDNVTYTRTCIITIGDFLELGTKNSEGRRCLWARHSLQYSSGSYKLLNLAEGVAYTGNSQVATTCFGWGELTARNTRQGSMYFNWGTYNYVNNGSYGKYTSTDKLPHLQRIEDEFAGEPYNYSGEFNKIDDVATVWNSACNMPECFDVKEIINNCDYNASKHQYTSRIPGYTDCFLTLAQGGSLSGDTYGVGRYGFWTCEYDHGYDVSAIFFDGNNTPPVLVTTDKIRRGMVRPVKYVE